MTGKHPTQMATQKLDELCINAIRTLSIDAVEKADSGHPGLPMGAAPLAYVLWTRHLKHDPSAPGWPDRDRFVLSAGHGSMLLYSLLHLFGYDLKVEDLKSFRQWGSRTPGHPEHGHTSGVEATTGPLGQGTANAVGMAIAERALAARFNGKGRTLVDHYTYALVSDGDLMEGVSAEAGSLAGHLRLSKLIYLYDSNDVSLDGPTSLAFTEDVGRRYEAYGWQVQRVEDADEDLEAIDQAIARAKAERERPSLIIARTTIGYGSPNKKGTAAVHGSPLGAKEAALAKQELGWEETEPFTVPSEVREHFASVAARVRNVHASWREELSKLKAADPELHKEWQRVQKGALPPGWDSAPASSSVGSSVATRSAAGKSLNAFARALPELIGGDADLSGSTKTALEGERDFDGRTGAGRNLHFGVREHAMGAIANGIAYHGGLRPYTATFFVFSDYMRPAMRLAAVSKLPVVFVFTHDSIALGEDGPTHQPVEHLMSLRAMPNLHVVRPADAFEAHEAWRYALGRQDGPTALVLTRQNLPVLQQTRERSSDLRRGAYVLSQASGAQEGVLIATGSEVHLALAAQAVLATEKVPVSVVSMPCWEAFEMQAPEYRASVLPRSTRARVSIEAGATFGWRRWIGENGVAIGLDRFGASAPGEVNLAELGFTVQAVVEALRSQL